MVSTKQTSGQYGRRLGSDSGKKAIVETLIFPEGTGAESVDMDDADERFKVMEENFDVIQEIAEGGQGRILQAKDRFLNRHVIVKSLKSSAVTMGTNAKAFVDEAKLTAQLDHPSIIPIYSVNTDQKSQPCFAMKLVKGITLAEYIDEIVIKYRMHGVDKFDERMSLGNRLDCFLKICDAVTYAHNKGVIHRDLKPDNIMIGEFHEVYVMDWGIAECVNQPNPAVERMPEGVVAGTPGYIDPDYFEDNMPHPQGDVFALGVILYKMVTLKDAVIGENPQQMILNSMEGNEPPVQHRFGLHIDSDLGAIVDHARAAKRACRYQSVDELAADVRRYLCNTEVVCRPDNLPRRVRRWIQHHLHWAITMAMGLILAFALLAVHSLYRQNQAIRQAKVRELSLTQYQAEVARQAHVLDAHFLHLAHLLTRMGDKITWSLGSPPRTTEQKTYASSDFDEEPPPGTVHSPACNKAINLDHPVHVLAPGVKRVEVQNGVQTVTGLRDTFLTTQLASSFDYSPDRIPDLKQRVVGTGLPVKWAYAGFERGYFVAFPGKGGYPASFDPRKRPWYIEGRQHTGIHWGAPYYDVSGQGIVLPCTYQLIGKDGRFIGVAALDITLDYLTTQLMGRDKAADGDIEEKTILDSKGRILISTRFQKRNKRGSVLSDYTLKIEPYPQHQVRSEVVSRKHGQFTLNEDGREFVYAFAEIQTLGWYYLVKIEAKGL